MAAAPAELYRQVALHLADHPPDTVFKVRQVTAAIAAPPPVHTCP